MQLSRYFAPCQHPDLLPQKFTVILNILFIFVKIIVEILVIFKIILEPIAFTFCIFHQLYYFDCPSVTIRVARDI